MVSEGDLRDLTETKEAQGALHLTETSAAVVLAGVAPSEPLLSKVGLLMMLTVICGCACQAPYEVLNSGDKGCSHLVSLTEHIFGLVATSQVALRRPQLPLAWHFCLAAGSIGYTQFQNAALGTQLPTLVLITIKNGNLAANVFLGKCILGRCYGVQQLLSVLLLSAGLVLVSVAGIDTSAQGANDSAVGGGGQWSSILGIVLLAAALLSRAAGALAQEQWCHRYSVPVDEILFFRSLLGLPAVLMHWPQISMHASQWMGDGAVAGLAWHRPWLLLALNTIMDYACRVCVTHIIERTSALTANLVLTFQRFVSFIISAVVLSNQSLRWNLWLGALAVLAGTVLYAASPSIKKRIKED
eukprot:TRINITY_DN2886_c0_g1_i2.p1 TRINITY_DN2886_c0_g1~~TRINITY_DN2886_c0_g1_i2.p1  ORF type:complete len:357 (-),score=55.44 TRINITY_DN2886_c0_g1_i2:234-1304(-)